MSSARVITDEGSTVDTIEALSSNGYFHRPDDLVPLKRKEEEASSMPPLPEYARIDPAIGKYGCEWLDEYVKFSRRWSPRAYDDFHEAIGLWLLSTIAARRVVLNLGGRRHTNLYIALASRTTVYAKSTTAKIAIQILKELGLGHLLAADDSTPQAFIQNLASKVPEKWDAMTDIEKEKHLYRLAFAGQRGWFFDEFGQKISSMMREGGHMADYRGIFRRFDDENPVENDTYEYKSISRGTDTVRNPYLALLVNLTPADLKPYAKKGSALWGDGFWARFAFITPPDEDKRSRGRFPREERIIPQILTRPLHDWHLRLGIAKPTITEVRNNANIVDHYEIDHGDHGAHPCTLPEEVYEAWYQYSEALLDIVEEDSQYSDLDGNYGRMPEKALRIAMLFASLENHGSSITMTHWAKAQEIAERWRQNLHNLYDQVNESEQSKFVTTEQKIMKMAAQKGSLSKRDVYMNVREVDAKQAAILLDSLCNAGLMEKFKDGQKERFRLTG